MVLLFLNGRLDDPCDVCRFNIFKICGCIQNGRAKVPGLLFIGGQFMRKPAKEGRLKVKDCKLQVEKAGADAGKQHSTLPTWLLALLLALVTVALYWPAMRCDFITLDDPDFVTANLHVQGGLSWEGVKWAFCNTKQATYWAPLMWLSHELACQFFGLNPWGHHLINVLLHAANSALVFLLFQRMTRATWRSLLLAALFGWHPLRVESVAWVTERKDVLSGLFGLLCLMAYARYARGAGREARGAGGNSVSYWFALLFFACGLMSKPMLVTWPFVMLLLDYWPLQRFKVQGSGFRIRSLVVEKIPFFALAAASSLITMTVQAQGGAFEAGENLSLGARVGNALISYCFYLGKMFWPVDLAVYYPHPGYWPLAEVLLVGVFLCGVSALLFLGCRRHPFLLMGWLWFVGTLVPVIGLVQVGGQSMADRYMYIPSLGVLILIVWGAHELTKGLRFQKIAFSAAGSALIVLCLALTRQQLGYWKDSEKLYRHTLAVTENNYFVHNFFGQFLNLKGQTDEAIGEFREALRLHPDFPNAHNSLGIALGEKGQTAGAIDQFNEAIRLKPDDAAARYNLGYALFTIGETDKATGEFQEAIRLKPDYQAAFDNLSKVMAINNMAWALATSPDANVRDGARAVELAERACESTQYRVTMMVGTLAAAYAEAGRFDEAVVTGQKACAMASQQGETDLLKRNQELVILYQSHQPYHESIPASAP